MEHPIATTEEIVFCPLCNGKRSEALFSAEDRSCNVPGIFIIRKCKLCGLAYLSPRPTQKELPRFYPKGKYFPPFVKEPKGKTQGQKAFKKPTSLLTYLARAINQVWLGYDYGLKGAIIIVAKAIIFIFKKVLVLHPYFQLPHFHKNGKLLEIGFGSGADLLKFRNLGWSVAGADVDRTCCDNARDNLKIKIIEIREGNIQAENESFDVVFLRHAFEHLPNPHNALREYHRILTKNGQLIIEIPNFGCKQANRWKSLWRGLEVPRHLFFYTPETIYMFLKKTGYTKIHIRPIVASALNVFYAFTPPTPENNASCWNTWWNNRFIPHMIYFLWPSFGYGDSLYITGRK